jgi:hypothetical protein
MLPPPIKERRMFVQIIKGKVGDQDRFRAAVDRWERELAPGAEGWLGSTAGVTDDGTLIAIVRFESAEAAQRNSDRPEQGEWWADAAQAFSEDPTFVNSSEVDVSQPGDPGEAGFVQLMEGHGSDVARARELIGQDSQEWSEFRPEILGNLTIHSGDGDFLMAVYFTSEAAAHEGEQKEIPAELKPRMDELNSLLTGPPTFYDLKEPWLSAP